MPRIHRTGSLAKKQGDADRAYETSKQEYDQTKSMAPLGTLPERGQTDPKSYREEWRNEQDLAAQRDMANWAWWMLIATCASTVVTGVGIYFVAETLRANLAAVEEAAKAAQSAQRSVKVSEDTAQRQLRAYINLESAHIVLGEKINVGLYPATLDVIFRNFGSTPAHDVEVFYEISQAPAPNEVLSKRQRLGSIGSTAVIRIREPLMILSYDKDAMSNGTPTFRFSAYLSYATVFDVTSGYSRFTEVDVKNGPEFFDEASSKTLRGFHMTADGPKNRST